MPGTIITALEEEYGVAPDEGWQSYGLNADGIKSRKDTLKRAVLKRRLGAPALAGVRHIDKGAEWNLTLDAASNGLGQFLACAASEVTTQQHAGGTLSFDQIFDWTADGVPEGYSLAATAYRDRRSGVEDLYQYAGGKVMSVEFGQSKDGFLTLSFGVDFKGSERLTVDPDYDILEIIPDFIYAWADALITLTPKEGGDPETECVDSFTVTLNQALNVEDYCLNRLTGKHEPTRQSDPEHTGTITWNYQHPRYFDAFKSGDAFELTANWQAPIAIEGSIFPSLTIHLGTIVFEEPNDPELQTDGPTTQSMPFAVKDDESGDPVATVTLVTSDDDDFSLPIGS